MLSNLLADLGNHTNAKIEESMVRHMVLNSLRALRIKFHDEYGEMVIACDNTNYWRKQFFPYYKANRKKNQEKSEIDWKHIFQIMNTIRQELKDYFPYTIIDVEAAEADDVIGTLVQTHGDQNIPIIIVSGDKDFIQLHRYKNVKQWDAIRKKWLTHDNPEQYLLEQILVGDSKPTGDGIPNILSPDNCLVIGQRQKPMTQKRKDYYMKVDFTNHEDEEITRNFFRNKALIDLRHTPVDIQEKILEEFKTQKRDRSQLMGYFIKHRLKNLLASIGEF